jgi:DNA primase
VVAPQGTAFTEGQARVLKRFVKEVVLCFDADAAGKKAAERSLDALLQNDLVVRVAEMPAGEDPDSLVRRNGKEDFETRIATARDFFEFWIEREASTTNLSSLGAKMELARNLAETVSHVRDPLMRGEIASRVAARLGVATSDFENLLTNQTRVEVRLPQPPRPAATAAPPQNVAMLCLFALRNETAREFLHEQNWREILAQTPNAELLLRILEAQFQPGDPASLNAFMATLNASEEALVSSWLLQKVPPNAGVVVEDWWRGLQQAVVRRQLQIAEGRMKLPQVSTGEVVNLQKQILDLRKQLHELSQFSPALPHES